MKFKIDVSDRETGEVATLEVDAPNAQAARRHLREAGYMVWATVPVGSPTASYVNRRNQGYQERLDFLVEESWHGTFRAHPVRYVVAPVLRLAAGILLWLSVAKLFLTLDLPVVFGQVPPTSGNLAWMALVCWGLGWWVGLPVARGRRAQRAWADAQMVCRYCRRRGHVTTSERGAFRQRRLWGRCTCCGIQWPL